MVIMATEENNIASHVEDEISTKTLSKVVSTDDTSNQPTAAGDNLKQNGNISEEIMVEEEEEPGPSASESKETVDFKVIFNKQKYDVTFPLDDNIAALKLHILTLTGVPPAMQKVMYKGLAKDDKSLRELGVINGAKLMIVGSTLNDVLAVSTPSSSTVEESKGATGAVKEPLSRQKIHKKILDKGIPEDVMPGIKNDKDSLPPFPLSGMLNKSGGKVRLTFKLELDQLWIGTKERTDKIPMSTIKNVNSEPIEGHEEYHIMGIQLGPTEASRYWIYWVPAQYIDAIKDAILGKWQLF